MTRSVAGRINAVGKATAEKATALGLAAAFAAGAVAVLPSLAWAEGEAARCLATAGTPDAGVPRGAEDAARRKAAIIASAADCEAAGQAVDASAEVLFHAGEVARAKGQAGPSFALFERAAEKGLAAAQTRLGDFYTFGVAPGGKDPEAAAGHYSRAAEAGDLAGMTTLALMYRVGQGVAQDTGRMLALMTEAAEGGYHFAAYGLAQVYLTGDGIPGNADPERGIPDAARAAHYFEMAAKAGRIEAALEAAALYRNPAYGLAENPEAELRLTRMASRAGLPKAIAAMGVLYETGRGVAGNPEIAAGLYVRALESGAVSMEALRDGANRRWDPQTAMAFQTILKDRGLYRGYIDGDVGGGTIAAARKLAPATE